MGDSHHYDGVPAGVQFPSATTDEAWARLGAWLRSVRKRRRFTQEQAAALSGISTTWYRVIETGRTTDGKPYGRPERDTLLRIEAALFVPQGSCKAVLDGRNPVDLDALPPIAITEPDNGGQRVIYVGPVDNEKLHRAASDLAERYRRTG